MTTPPLSAYFFYWNLKTPVDNTWHPLPGHGSTRYLTFLPAWTSRLDLSATAVDAAPFVAGAGGLAHLSQLTSLGWTAPASIFRNATTMAALHRTAMFLPPVILGCQAVGLEYRYLIPRWAHERERARDEDQARTHVETGMLVGGAVMVGRSLAGLGPRWSLLDVVLGGAVADLALREYYKAHGV